MEFSPDTIEYHPVLLSRRGEFIAWLFAVISGGLWLLLWFYSSAVVTGIPVLFFFFLLSAILISLTNWNDRTTAIQITSGGINFVSRLKRTRLDWAEIERIDVFPGSWGSKILVIGDERKFSFRTLGKVILKGQEKGRVGFPEGDEILDSLVHASGLKLTNSQARQYTYSRK